MEYERNNKACFHILKSLKKELEELARLLYKISDADYIHKDQEAQAPMGSNIGEHARHALDHILCVIEPIEKLKARQLPSPPISYDRRQRNTPIEKNRLLCIEKIHDCIEKINLLNRKEEIDPKAKRNSSALRQQNLLQENIEIEHMANAEAHYVILRSNITRELMFVCHHLIHHKAFIAIKLRLLSGCLDPGFGVAPATQNQAPKLCSD